MPAADTLSEAERVAPYPDRAEILPDGIIYPDFSTPLIPSQQNSALIDSLYSECDMLLNADESNGYTLEQRIQAGKLIKHPLSDEMFGQVPDNAQRVKKQINIAQGSISAMTGLYAAAGDILSISVPESLVGTLTIVVAPSLADIPRGQVLTRLPKIRREFNVDSAQKLFGTPYGGLIVLEFVAAPDSDVVISISGAVETPHYVLGKTSEKDWKLSKETKGLSAHFSANNVQIICPVNAFELPINPEKALKFWSKAQEYLDNITKSGGAALMYYDSFYLPYSASENAPCYFDVSPANNPFDIVNITKNGAWDVFFGLAYRNVSSQKWANANELAFMSALSLSMDTTMFGSAQLVLPPSEAERYSDYHGALTIAKNIGNASDFDSLHIDVRLSMYAVLVHRFSYEGIKALFKAFENYEALDEQSRRDDFLIKASQAFDYDMRMFFDYFKFNNSFASKDAAAKLNLRVFYPACVDYVSKSFIVNAGESYKLDIGSSLVSLYGDVKLGGIKYGKGTFTETETDCFVFTPVKNDKKPSGELTVHIKTPSETLRHKGYFFSTSDPASLPTVFAKAKVNYIFVVPIAKYIALFSSLGAGFITGIALAVIGCKRKNKAQAPSDAK